MSIVAAELVARVTADVSQAERELKGFSQRMGSMTGSVFSGNLLSGGVAALGRGLADVGRITVGAFGDMMNVGMDFAAQMDAVTAVLGGTAEEASALSDLAINLAIDPRLKVDATEAATAIQNLATAGLTAQDILGGATEATVLLANSTGGDFGQAATVATDVMSLFNIKAEDMMGAVDGIAAVSNVSKFDLNDYALAIAQAGGVASMSGVSFEDFNAIIAGTAPAFASGSDAGTSFKTFLQRLNPTTKEARDIMADLGLLTAEGTSVFYDATGALKDMDDVVSIMNDTFGDMTEQQQSFYLGQLFGVDAMRTAGQVAGMTREEYQALLDTMAQTDAIESAAIRTDNLKSKWENFNGAIEATKLKIFTALEPAAMMIMDAISPVLDWATPQLTQMATNIGSWLQERIPVVEVAVKTVYEMTDGNVLASIMTGIGELTGAKVTIDTEAKVTEVDWGWFKYTYKADGEVTHWELGEIGVVRADGTIRSITWGGQTVMDENHPISVAARITVNNANELGLQANQWMKDLDAQLRTMPLGQEIGVTVSVAEVMWGVYTNVYDVSGKVALMLWGTWTNIYDVTADVLEVMWRDWTNTYPVLAEVQEVLWGLWTHTYDAVASIGNWINNIGTVQIPGTVVVSGGSGISGDFYSGERAQPSTPVRRRASGDPLFSGGLTWVGERGPELVALPRASRIYSNEDSRGMMGGATQIIQYNTVRQPHEIELLAQRVAAHMARKGR